MINSLTKQTLPFCICLLFLIGPLSDALCQDSLLYKLTELPTIRMYVDSFKNDLTISDIKKKTFHPFNATATPNPNYTYWFKFSLPNQDTQLTTIKLAAYVFDSLTLINFIDGQQVTEHRGLLIKYNQKTINSFRTLSSNKYEFKVSLLPTSNQLYFLRIKNKTRFESNFSSIGIYSNGNHNLTTTIWYLLFNAILLSILFFLSLFALMQYFQNRDLSYFLYAVFTLLYGIVMWRKFEKSNSFINWPFLSQPEYYYHSEIPLTLLTYSSQFLFLMYFVNAKKEIPFLFNTLRFGIIASLFYLVCDQLILYIWGFETSWKAFASFRLFLVVIASITFYYLFKLRSILAYYLLAGTFIVFIGALLTTYLSQTLNQHFYGVWDIALLPNQITILIETLLLALGLGYKSRLTEREKTTALYQLDIEKKEKESQQKSRERLFNWFTNISHEIRTPLTIILGLINKIKENPTHEFQTKLNILQQNANGLQKLTTQIIDLSKLDSGIFSIKNSRIDIIKYISYLTDSFRSLAIEKNLSLSNYSRIETYELDHDTDKIKIIVSNLITNAVKYTPEYGEIKVIVDIVTGQEEKENRNLSEVVIGKNHSETDYVLITVKDNGLGIPPNQLENIFERLYRVEEMNNARGSGIGLSLVKELTLLLKGTIKVQSEIGSGSSFSVYLPVHIQENNNPLENKIQPTLPKSSLEDNSRPIKQYNKGTHKPLLLIVEDSKDVIYYLGLCLKERYEILEAHNGLEGYELAVSHVPDIIISDVMMPIKNGYQLCEDLKKNFNTSHIPILLLTARAAKDHINKGFKVNANAYLIKPFDENELLERLRSLLFYKEQIKNHVQLHLNSPNRKKLQVDSNIQSEILFLNQLEDYVQKQIDNSAFKVPQLAKALLMSETQLNRKVKAITEKTPAQFILHFRLKEAYHLIETTDKNLGVIAIEVGFRNQQHFSMAFRKLYGIKPSSLRK